MSAVIIAFPVKQRDPVERDEYAAHSYRLLKENFGHQHGDEYLRQKATEWAQVRRDFEQSGCLRSLKGLGG